MSASTLKRDILTRAPSYDDVNGAALAQYPGLLEFWLPGGRIEGREYACGDLTGAPGQSLSINIDTGVWKDFATGDGGSDPISLFAAINNMTQGDALRELANELKVSGVTHRAKPTTKSKASTWAPIMQVPEDAPQVPLTHNSLGKPSMVWAYRDAGGNITFHVCRFDAPDGKKDIRPITFCVGPNGRKEWRWQGIPEPRPLYGLDRLALVKPDAGVLLVEGEKTCDAAARLYGPDIICMTWSGGSGAVGKTDFTPLKGRTVLISPDADKPGFEAALQLVYLLMAVGAASVNIIVPEADAPQCWDLADAEAEGWTADKVTAWERDSTVAPEQFQAIAQKRFGIEIKAVVTNVEQPQSHQYQAALRVLEAIGRADIIYAMGSFWRWSVSGVWRRIEDLEIKQLVQRTEASSKYLTGPFVNCILALVQNEMYRPDHAFDKDMRAINCSNGELHWTAGEWELRPHHRENYRTSQIPVSFDPVATAPRFEQFLEEIFRDDPDREDKIVLVCEAIGYSLLATCEYEKFFLLIGFGANGKSVLMAVVADLVGVVNSAAVQPSQFENKFQRAHLHGKLVNLVTEIAQGVEIADAPLKAIVSGEITTAEHKLKTPFEFSPICTCWFGTNHIPHTRDFSDGLFRRAEILTFNRTFGGAEQDKKLRDKLRAELPGILNLVLQAMAGVFERGYFTTTVSSEVAKKDWRLQADQVAQFVEDCCFVAAGNKETSERMYQTYKEWAAKVGINRTLNQKNFTNRMCKLGAETDRVTGGKRALCGFSLIKDVKNISDTSDVSDTYFEINASSIFQSVGRC